MTSSYKWVGEAGVVLQLGIRALQLGTGMRTILLTVVTTPTGNTPMNPLMPVNITLCSSHTP